MADSSETPVAAPVSEPTETTPTAEHIAPVDDAEWLLRLTFSPEHYFNGMWAPAAVSLEDLASRGFSVSREAMVELGVLHALAARQQGNKPEKREKALLSRFQARPVRELHDETGPLLVVEAKPEPDNPAHAAILSATKRSESQLRKVRSRLLPLLTDIRALEDYTIPDHASA